MYSPYTAAGVNPVSTSYQRFMGIGAGNQSPSIVNNNQWTENNPYTMPTGSIRQGGDVVNINTGTNDLSKQYGDYLSAYRNKWMPANAAHNQNIATNLGAMYDGQRLYQALNNPQNFTPWDDQAAQGVARTQFNQGVITKSLGRLLPDLLPTLQGTGTF